MGLHLNDDLGGNRNQEPYPAPNHALIRNLVRKPVEKPNPSLFPWLYGLKYWSLCDLVNHAPYREIWPPGRPVGR